MSDADSAGDVLLAVDVTAALSSFLGEGAGFADASLDALVPTLTELATAAATERQEGGLAFLGVQEHEETLADLEAWCRARSGAQDVVLAGIGGSAMGARVLDALRPPPRNVPTLHVVDTVDPAHVQGLLAQLTPETTLLIGVSLSGTTMETAAVFRVVEAWMEAALGKAAAERIAVVGGGDANPLCTHARARGAATFPIPPGVGGRYSVLTSVGLLPALACGLDVGPLLAGASRAAARCLVPSLPGNPALALAALYHLCWTSGRHVAVLWGYGRMLDPVGPWWVQLVAESLGKHAAGGPVGITPMAATGPADQHSVLQLLLEGPDDKLTLFLDAGDPRGEGPEIPADADEIAPVGATPLGALLVAELEATAFALARTGRPAARIHLARADAEAVGALLVTFEMATVYAGRLLEVDPFDQPAVALGKRATRARLKGEPRVLADEMDEMRERPRRVSSL
jgi:glucose-6-phosphate isomerase